MGGVRRTNLSSTMALDIMRSKSATAGLHGSQTLYPSVSVIFAMCVFARHIRCVAVLVVLGLGDVCLIWRRGS